MPPFASGKAAQQPPISPPFPPLNKFPLGPRQRARGRGGRAKARCGGRGGRRAEHRATRVGVGRKRGRTAFVAAPSPPAGGLISSPLLDSV